MKKLRVYTDGWSRGNPWSSGLWVYITDEKGNEVEKRYKSLGIKTNNQAEYLGAYYGIKRAIELWASDIELYMDSQLIIEQLSGNYKVKNPELKIIYGDIQSLLTDWNGTISFTHIPREKNTEADRLSNIAMDHNK